MADTAGAAGGTTLARRRSLGTGVRVVIGVVGLAAGLVLVLVAVRAWPPSQAEQLATARRLEALLPVVDRLGLDGWHDCLTCQPIDIRPGSSPEPLPSGQTAFATMQAATVGAVPGGRLVEITTLPATATGGRMVEFTAVARSMVGAETGHDLWIWTWSQDPRPASPDAIDAHWSFRAESAPETR